MLSHSKAPFSANDPARPAWLHTQQRDKLKCPWTRSVVVASRNHTLTDLVFPYRQHSPSCESCAERCFSERIF